MALLKYFQIVSNTLLSPDGPLSVSALSWSDLAANKKVKTALEQATSSSTARKRGSYDDFTPEEKARIAKRASEHGVTAAIHYFSWHMPMA